MSAPPAVGGALMAVECSRDHAVSPGGCRRLHDHAVGLTVGVGMSGSHTFSAAATFGSVESSPSR
jgi:hypothetical protein